MENDVKRYLNWCQATHGHQMMETSDGPWVLAEDYDRLRAALEIIAARDERDLCQECGSWKVARAALTVSEERHKNGVGARFK